MAGGDLRSEGPSPSVAADERLEDAEGCSGGS